MEFAKQRRIMVDSQVRVNDVTDTSIVSAFSNIPREKFVPKSMQASAYAEYEIATSDHRALWIPRDLGKLLTAMEPRPQDVSLVIGAGAGYSAALIGHMTKAVIALEEDDALVDAMSDRFAEIGLDKAVAVSGKLELGVPKEGPFDVILVAGMVETVPDSWGAQLAEGGRLGVVVGQSRTLGRARIYTRSGDVVSYRDAFECCPPILPGFEAASSFVF